MTVHGFNQACETLAKAEGAGRGVRLLSGIGAAVYGGVGWWRGLVSAACAHHPNTRVQDILDCANAPGAAMAALRGGQLLLVLDPACPAFAAVASAANRVGATVLAIRPPSLDLDRPGALRTLDAWLAADDFAGEAG